MNVHIRWLIRRDMPEVLAIEHASFEHPWCEEEFLRVLRQRNCIGMVAERGERIVGLMVYEHRKAARGHHGQHIRVIDFAVHPDWRRKGVGSAMLANLVDKLHPRRPAITLAVRESALAMHLLLRARGFRASGVRRGYYEDSGEDAFVFAYRVPAREPAAVTRA